MVITNYECWANIGGDTHCDITLQQAQLRSQIDPFNPRTISTCGIAQKGKCAQQNECYEMSPKRISQISSNGYYGFTYVNNNDDVAGNGNDVNISFGTREANKRQHHVFDNNLNRNRTIAFDNSLVSKPKKRVLVDGQFGNNITKSKRCRLENVQERLNSSPVLESTFNMDVDDIESPKEENGLLTFPHQIGASGIAHNIIKSQHSTLITAKFKVLACNQNYSGNAEACGTIESKGSSMYEANTINQDIPCFDKNEMFLELMFAETHGSGVYYLQNLDFDESLCYRNDI